MRVLIVGDNEINGTLEKSMAKEEIRATTITDADHVLKCKGEPGRYAITTRSDTFIVASVIITEPPRFEAPEIDGRAAYNLMDADVYEKLSRGKTAEPIVIALDYAS